MEWILNGGGAWPGMLVGAIIICAWPAWFRLTGKSKKEPADLGDWILRYVGAGIICIFIGGAFDWTSFMLAGGLLIAPLYPIAVLGILGKVDDTVTDIIIAIRKR